MKNEIKNPEQTTFYICREDDMFKVTAYGVVGPNQQMQTGQPIMDTYLDKTEWENVLLEEGIELEEEGSHGFAGVSYQKNKV